MCAKNAKKRARDADAGPSSEPFPKQPTGAAQKPLPKSATILQRVVHALRARGEDVDRLEVDAAHVLGKAREFERQLARAHTALLFLVSAGAVELNVVVAT